MNVMMRRSSRRLVENVCEEALENSSLELSVDYLLESQAESFAKLTDVTSSLLSAQTVNEEFDCLPKDSAPAIVKLYEEEDDCLSVIHLQHYMFNVVTMDVI